MITIKNGVLGYIHGYDGRIGVMEDGINYLMENAGVNRPITINEYKGFTESCVGTLEKVASTKEGYLLIVKPLSGKLKAYNLNYISDAFVLD